MKWSLVYEGARDERGRLFFPEELSEEKLLELRKSQGPYKFANQYLNQTIPEEDQDFKKLWLRGYTVLPENTYTFVFIDPAISLSDKADYTATVIVKVDADQNWYLTHAIRQRITATETVDWIFKVFNQFKPAVIGIEDVAYQKALLHFMSEEMRKRNQFMNLRSIRRSVLTQDGKKSNNSKPLRIRSLIPYFEYGKIFISQGLDDFLMEYAQFPRGSHDDLLDALASIKEIVFYPEKPKENKDVKNPHDPRYESKVIRDLVRKANSGDTDY